MAGATAALLVSVGGIGITHATKDSGSGPVSAYFPIEPCRLAAGVTIVPDSSAQFPGRGASGGCNLPNSVTVLAANVTVIGATEQTKVRFYAADGDVPETANLNPAPGCATDPERRCATDPERRRHPALGANRRVQRRQPVRHRAGLHRCDGLSTTTTPTTTSTTASGR